MSKRSPAIIRAHWLRWRTRGQAAWQALSLREQRVLTGGALLLVGLLLWALLIQPPLKTIAYWQAQTPKLQGQAQALESLLREAGVQAAGGDTEQALRQSLEAYGLAGHYQLQAGPNGGWQLTFDAAPADALIDWLLGRQRPGALPVVEAHLQRAGDNATDDSAGTLSGTVRMDQAQGAKEAS
ncbi:general secretion pathway protein M [Pseudomonas sp. StFLB209]|uniref:type II secretion system protein GspM n=1 Tax=Pseudomonas sp. StFLB209 TaxID=1028989 RepID=UPI0004F87B48|nr:type II secretion system protein GspM [Pseudomonas sp. StFLB209]BAP42216.1 general secretion pathway protein M [Pseudomonas sp. StFLB209]